MDPPDAAAAALVQWLVANGAPQPRLAVRSLQGRGRGLFTRTPVAKGEALFHIPGNLVMTTARAEQECCLPFEPGSSSRNDALTAWLCEQLHYGRAGDSRGERWAPWIAVIPELGGTVLDWPEQDVQHLLHPSTGIGAYARAHLAAFEGVCARLEPLVAAAEASGAAPAGAFSRAPLRRAHSLVASRAWAGAMAPFADFCNHDAGAVPMGDAVPGLDEREDGAFVLRANRDYVAGQEVLISYGALSSSQLLIQYGFCPAPGANANEAVHLAQLGAAAGSAAAAAAAAAGAAGGAPLAAHRVPSDPSQRTNASYAQLPPPPLRLSSLFVDLLLAHTPEELVSGPGVAPEALAALLRMRDDPWANVFDAGWRGGGGGGGARRAWGATADFVAMEALRRVCLAQLAAYPTSTAEDAQAALDTPAGGGFEQRAALCAAIRLQERRDLAALVAWVDTTFERAAPYLARARAAGATPHEALMTAQAPPEVEAAGRRVAAEAQAAAAAPPPDGGAVAL